MKEMQISHTTRVDELYFLNHRHYSLQVVDSFENK